MSTLSTTNLKHPSSASNNVVLDSSGRVGIGTTSPTARLDVRREDTDGLIAEFHQSTGYGVDIRSSETVASVSSGYLQALTFRTDPGSGQVERARIDSSGNLKFNSGYGSVATAYGCRAWVNFDGTGTIATRASGNVSSISDQGTGDTIVNFTTALPDANFCWTATAANQGPGNRLYAALNAPNTTSSLRVTTYDEGGTAKDSTYVFVAVFR